VPVLLEGVVPLLARHERHGLGEVRRARRVDPRRGAPELVVIVLVEEDVGIVAIARCRCLGIAVRCGYLAIEEGPPGCEVGECRGGGSAVGEEEGADDCRGDAMEEEGSPRDGGG